MSIFKTLKTLQATWKPVKFFNLQEEADKAGLDIISVKVIPSELHNTLPSIQIRVFRGGRSVFYMIRIAPDISYHIGAFINPSDITILELAQYDCFDKPTNEGHILRAKF
jgi:hypothetical protein